MYFCFLKMVCFNPRTMAIVSELLNKFLSNEFILFYSSKSEKFARLTMSLILSLTMENHTFKTQYKV